MQSRPTTRPIRRRAARRSRLPASAPAPLRRWLVQEWGPVAATFGRWPILALLALALPVLLLVYQFAAPERIDVGGTDDALYLRGFFAPEAGNGATFRWSGDQSAFVVPAAPGNSVWDLDLRLGAQRPPGFAPPAVEVFADDRLIARFDSTIGFQDYHFRLERPALAAEDLRVRLVTTTFDPPGDDDNRPLGVAVDRATLTPAHRGGWQPYLPPPGHALLVVGILGLAAALLGRLGVDLRVALGLLGALLLGIAAGQWLQPGRTVVYLRQLLIVAALLYLVMLLLRPPIRRLFAAGGVALAPGEEQWLVRIVLFGAGLHLAGVIYPGFRAHDLLFQAHRVEDILRGQFLLSTLATEFGYRRAPYPPAVYLLAAPFAALTRDSTWPLRMLVPILDATSAIAICYLGRRCRLPAPAPLLAAAFYPLVPATFQFLWWGFFSNLFGQWATLLALTIIVGHWGELRRPAIFGGAVASLCLMLLSHPGTFVLSLALLPPLAAGLLIAEPGNRRDLRPLLAALALSLAIVFLLYYRHYLGLLADQLQGFFGPDDRDIPGNNDRGWEPNYIRLRVFAFPFLLYLLATLAAGVGLVRARNRLGWMLLAMILTSTAFAIIHVALGVWVRYFVFLAPALALGAGVSVAWLYERGRAWRLAAWGALAYGGVAATVFWVAITVGGQRSPYP